MTPKMKNKLMKLSTEEFLKLTAEEAWDRRYFIAHISSVLIGGLIEFYKSRVGAKNGEKFNVKGWLNEAERIAKVEFERDLLHSVKGMSDYDKAYEKIKQEVIESDDKVRRLATNRAADTYGRELSVPLDDADTQAYFDMMDATYDYVKRKGFNSEVGEKKPARRGDAFDK